MPFDTRLEKITLGFALGVPSMASLLLMFVAPGRVSATTYVAAVVLLVGTGIVALRTWNGAQATGSVGQLIYETNTSKPIDHAPSIRRIVVMLVLSAVTTAAMVATWLS